MSKVIHFEIVATNPKRAVKFYEKAFGWEITKWKGPEDYWLCKAGDEDEYGINGAIKPAKSSSKNIITINSFNLDESVERVKKAGGKIISKIQTVPGIVRFCRFTDTEGNELEMSEEIS
ncbi:MAG TPA: VOC family protein [Caldisericia bacterium]|nr:VOC family protein [Caldisericia bacterium]HPF49418.1 VOC family protein [Caldisericia bacterium]HPI84379.1 VOC family protein [Caldisericia bacterium]HPQ93589.1 VOC family protein [Caldisericia bacterium]HRV75558.1 VOC family protein [Caldisericia bacterium]